MIRHPLARAGALLALLVWAPLPFGSVTPAAAAALVAAAFAVLALAWTTTSEVALARGARRVGLALAAIAAWGAAQSLAWPAAIAARLSPEHARLAGESAELAGGGEPAAIALSLAPAASRRAALVWLAAAAVLVAAALVGRSRRARRALLAAVAASALFQTLYGAQQWMVRATAIWGVEVPNQPSRLRGSFVNPNHLATYLLVATTIAFALLWWSLRRVRAASRAESRLVRLGPAVLLWLFLFAGLAFTRSRAGLVAALGGCLAQLALVAWQGERRRVLWGGAAALAAALGFVASTGFETGFGRLLRLAAGGDFRLAAMADAWGLVARFPWTGAGLGAFRAAFPLVHPVGEEGTWWHAHNDWLELAATTGLVGLALAAIALVALARGLAAAWRHGERSEDRAAALAAIGAAVAVGLQELADFGLTIPANAFTLAALCGAALAAPRAPAERGETS
ncbi:MAG TPA: O-antigen ligase family protein [Thermoanaerobaculia bacterium]